DSEPLGCIAPMEAGNSSQNVELSDNMIPEADINYIFGGQTRRSASEDCKNISSDISKKTDKRMTSSPDKDVNDNYLMVMNSGPSFPKNSNFNELLDFENPDDPLSIFTDECAQQQEVETAKEISDNKIHELLDSESVRPVNQKDFCLASIDLMKQFRIIEVKNQNVTKSEKKIHYTHKNTEAMNENPYKRVYKERVRKSSTRKLDKLSNATIYQDAFMKFLSKN
ncbi:unnamed protein product, partial [Meganyctiphanes norvegica]